MQIIEFNDVNDTGVLTAITPNISYNSGNFKWEATEGVRTEDESMKPVFLQITSRNYTGESESLSGFIFIEVRK